MEEQNQNITAISSVEKSIIEAQIVEALQTCYDPEIPVNIHELG